MQLDVYNQQGEKEGQARLPKEIFEVDFNPVLVRQIILGQMANRRQVSAHTKNRAEVSGGGRKPWRQKGTGRARHGSIRSPIWKGGGVSFGPTNQKVYKKIVPKKMRRSALFMVLSQKVKDGELFLVDDLKIENPKTKLMAQLISKLFNDKGSCLVVLPKKEDILIKALRNLSNVEIRTAKDLNALDLASFRYLLMPKQSIKAIEETFLNK